MSEQTILTFIITDPKDVSFTDHIYTSRNFLNEIKPVVLHEFKHFYAIYKIAGDDFLFRVVIHAGLMDSGLSNTGEQIYGEFRSKPEFKDLPISFVTRKPDWFGEDQFHAEIKGKRYYNSKYFNREDFIKDFLENVKVFRKGDLNNAPDELNSLPGMIKVSSDVETVIKTDIPTLDFAIITALYDDESTPFIKNSKADKRFNSKMSNLMRLKFKKNDDCKDYAGHYLLNHAQKMGMVDSTFNCAMLLEKYDPKFLLMAGVCGGKEGKKEDEKLDTTGLKYCDVIIANNIFDIQTGKLEKGSFKPYLYNEDLNNQLVTFFEQNKEKIKTQMYLLADQSDKVFFGRVQAAVIRIGDYGCGSQVINTDGFFKEQISARDGKAIAVEMESYSVYRSCKLHNTLTKERPTLPIVVKAVMDYTDSNKTDEYKTDAAKMSYLCIRAMMPLLMNFHEKIYGKVN